MKKQCDMTEFLDDAVGVLGTLVAGVASPKQDYGRELARLTKLWPSDPVAGQVDGRRLEFVRYMAETQANVCRMLELVLHLALLNGATKEYLRTKAGLHNTPLEIPVSCTTLASVLLPGFVRHDEVVTVSPLQGGGPAECCCGTESSLSADQFAFVLLDRLNSSIAPTSDWQNAQSPRPALSRTKEVRVAWEDLSHEAATVMGDALSEEVVEWTEGAKALYSYRWSYIGHTEDADAESVGPIVFLFEWSLFRSEPPQ